MNHSKYLLILTTFLFINSCGKDFGNLNVDPNNPQSVPPDALLTGVEKILADNVMQSFALGGILAQSWALNNYTGGSQYDLSGNGFNGWFQSQYSGALEDLEDIQTIIRKNPGLNPLQDTNKIAIAKILQVYTFQYLTDIFGPIPYNKALQGAKNRTPEYKSQHDIYFGLIKDLHDATALMNLSEASFSGADIIYEGDMSKWKKFSNSLLLRISMRMSDVESLAAKMEIENAFSEAFVDNSENACFKYLSSTPNNSPLHQQRIERGDADLGLSNILIDKTLKPLNDPRLLIWADERNYGGGYFGRPYGQSSQNAALDVVGNYSQPSGARLINNQLNNFKPYDVLRPDALSCLMGYAEVCFIKAEAIERGWNLPGTAAEWYNKGITASMNEWGISNQNDIDIYLAQNDVNYSTVQGDWKQKIGVQKWLALFMQGFQGWIEWRRLDFKKLELPIDGAIGDVGNNVAPARLIYPSDEQSLNATNYLKALVLLGGPDKMSTRVWWDVK